MVAAESADKEDVEAAKLLVGQHLPWFTQPSCELRAAGSLGTALTYRAPVLMREITEAASAPGDDAVQSPHAPGGTMWRCSTC